MCGNRSAAWRNFMSTQTEETTEEQSLKLLKQQIQQLAEESKQIAVCIMEQEKFVEEQKRLLQEQEAQLRDKKTHYRAMTKRVKDLIKAEHNISARSPVNLTSTVHRGSMNSKLYGHTIGDVSHRQFADNL